MSNNPPADNAPYQDAWEQNVTKRYYRYYTYVEPVISDPIIQGYFTLVASILLTAFFIFFALSPTFSTILGLTRKITDQGKLLAAMDAKISSLIIAQENYSQIEPSLPIIDTALPEKPQPETILADLLTIASSSGVKITSLQFQTIDLQGNTPAPVAAKKTTTNSPSTTLIASVGIPTTQFSLTVSGTLAQIRVFMGKAENLPRIITISSISVNTNSKLKSTDQLFADVSAAGYYLNNNSLKPPPASGK